ncbi:UDP-N-acetylmuramoyl-L-alanyl-D-glutamate--2,6-diaminopimelate ligase [Marinoscillum sp. 108]|uniref:UDP-N-acetylmuramoyl-L-alanyl-D-glutamate--2, 6-diaminopimelate ligase n=1 Tax=Marinoscillum sp. 108 TaxID=2653151 RepID=UPI0012EF10BF|nr:UDP-N-acetylmuramoyl-L-alanyl-D-glutamate--2,6-diaminopimelate ligase [Marinoscillum sp. 108]VXD15961.1 UDP-N-acetylmuramoyl-L-alanyl-D-glutamate--2, 6-diaminopimelate ligase [Marinoscillum sp. 108]
MKTLKDILYGVSLTELHGDREREISSLAFDSRRVKKGGLFIAIKGLNVDGHDYIETAIDLGAVAILCESLPEKRKKSITYVQVDNSAAAMGIVAANFHDNPSRKLNLVGVTGTNGKTTTATLLFQLFQQLGYKVGLLSTVENKIDHKVLDAQFTTPDSLQLNELLAQMVSQGCTHCFMEVSSHALVQHRTSGLQFAGGIFTNISHDHLDYHETFEAYIKAKKMLFDKLPKEAFALVNADDKRGMVMLQNTKAEKNTYSLKSMADFRAKILHNTLQGLELDVDGISAWFKLIGDFNAYNLLAVYAAGVLLEEEKEEVLTALSQIDGARGRFEQVYNGNNILAIVDYAHTPDALDNVLRTIDKLRTRQEKVITVIGCGGNRDKTKRPEMARIAAEFSNKVILTSDNPRDEDPAVILEEMMKGVPKVAQKNTMIIQDRKEAIRTACNLAEKMDIILVAGKGHETYQEIKGVRNHFDDKEILNEMLNGQ